MRQRKPQFDQHRYRATDGNDEVILVGGGRRAYLWVGENDEAPPTSTPRTTRTFSGAEGLRALARAILREVPAPKKKRSRALGKEE